MTAETDLPGGERNGALTEMIAADPSAGATVVRGLPYTIAELRYSIEHEMALTLSDLLMRRTRIAFETPDHGVGEAPAVADAVAGVTGWDKYQRSAQIDAYADDAARVFGIEP
jgi:glycerol-3-phosphate dehydrogenase